jgi:putative salt-induced outer membrane protein YdiY
VNVLIFPFRRTAGLALLALLWGASPQDGGAQTPSPSDSTRWRNTSEATALFSGGNSQQSSLGFRNALRRRNAAGELRVDLSTVRTDATRTRRFAVGDTSVFRVNEERITERTAERWSAQARYDRNLRPTLFLYGSSGWERNVLAGFRSRAVLSGGAGARLGDPHPWSLKWGAGLTYTFEDEVVSKSDRRKRFGGIRSTLDFERHLGPTLLELAWVADLNAQDWRSARGDLAQSVSAALSDRLALKTTLQLQLDNSPPLQRIPLQAPTGEPLGAEVLVPLKKYDPTLSVALVFALGSGRDALSEFRNPRSRPESPALLQPLP